MFNFIVFQGVEGNNTVTQAILCDENKRPIEGACFVTEFNASDRRTRINCQVFVGDEHKRLSVCTHVHNEKKIGAAASQFDGITYVD